MRGIIPQVGLVPLGTMVPFGVATVSWCGIGRVEAMADEGEARLAESGAVILVVEDDADIRRMMVAGLRRRGYRTVEAADGEEAWHVAQTTDVDLVVLDGGLPKLDGVEVLARIRALPRLATLPVILVTGRGGLADKVSGLGAGANDYLTKPVSFEELFARIEANLRGYRVWVERMTERLHERSLLAARLGAGHSGGDVIRHVVDTLATVPNVAGVAIIDISPSGRVSLRWASGTPWSAMLQTDSQPDPWLADELVRLVSSGAAVLGRDSGLGVRGPSSGRLVGAIIGHHAIAAQALLVEVDPTVAGQVEAVRNVLSLIVELVPMIENLLPSIQPTDPIAKLIQSLMVVLEQQAFHPVFQPIRDIDTNCIKGYEALTRFADGTPPDVRFEDAELAGLGAQFECATLRAALSEAVHLPSDRYLSINVSATLLAHPELPSILDLGRGRQLYLEITEHEHIDDYERVRNEFNGLGRDLRMSVDDAGSGWASLRHVIMLRPDIVKLDRMWVAGIDTDSARQALILGIGRFVSELGGDVVAEGIETQAELATLRRAGVHLGQGNLLGRPGTAGELAAD